MCCSDFNQNPQSFHNCIRCIRNAESRMQPSRARAIKKVSPLKSRSWTAYMGGIPLSHSAWKTHIRKAWMHSKGGAHSRNSNTKSIRQLSRALLYQPKSAKTLSNPHRASHSHTREQKAKSWSKCWVRSRGERVNQRGWPAVHRLTWGSAPQTGAVAGACRRQRRRPPPCARRPPPPQPEPSASVSDRTRCGALPLLPLGPALSAWLETCWRLCFFRCVHANWAAWCLRCSSVFRTMQVCRNLFFYCIVWNDIIFYLGCCVVQWKATSAYFWSGIIIPIFGVRNGKKNRNTKNLDMSVSEKVTIRN
jgi:hypothetical protein